MTDTLTTSRTRPGRPVSGHPRSTFPGRLLRWFPGRLLRWIAYDARLVVLGSQTMADAVTGEDRTAACRWEQLTRSQRQNEQGLGVGRAGADGGGRAGQL